MFWSRHKRNYSKCVDEAPTPKYIYTASSYITQTKEDPYGGFLVSEGKEKHANLKPQDYIAWTPTPLANFDDVEGTLTVFPCEELSDTVWIECPRTLWPAKAYPDSYYEGDQTVLARFYLEEVETFIRMERFGLR